MNSLASQQKIRFALVIHNHQPVGNRDEIIEKIYERAYLPFLQKLAEYPQIKLNLHYSGFLLEWFEQHHSEIIELLQRLVASGRVKMRGAPHFVPVISVIPDRDTIGQTKKLSEKVKSLFSVDPRGFWLA